MNEYDTNKLSIKVNDDGAGEQAQTLGLPT